MFESIIVVLVLKLLDCVCVIFCKNTESTCVVTAFMIGNCALCYNDIIFTKIVLQILVVNILNFYISDAILETKNLQKMQ
jgi:hypothetical protein